MSEVLDVNPLDPDGNHALEVTVVVKTYGKRDEHHRQRMVKEIERGVHSQFGEDFYIVEAKWGY
jgi:hypothetical protein